LLSKALSTENPLILLGTLFKQTKRSRPSYHLGSKLTSKSLRSVRMENAYIIFPKMASLYGSTSCSLTLSYGQLYGLEEYQGLARRRI
jgi:hypothetical protein